jgi:poly(A) polymerase
VISEALLALVRPLADRFAAEGHELYLVGGIVRDELRAKGQRTWVDIDLTTDAVPDEILRLVRPLAQAVWTQGARFGTIGCRIGATPFEITTYRGEAYDPSSRKPQVRFSTSLMDDLARRDFTINAIAADARDGALHDPFGGQADLTARLLRTPMGADLSFSDDPLRMLRAARFLARFELSAAPDIDAAIERQRDRLRIVSAERVRDELHKLLSVDDPTRGLLFLVDHGLLDRWIPELRGLHDVHDPADGDRDVLAQVIDTVRRCPPEPVLRMAALVHDLGKADGVLADHSARGARLVEERLRELRHAGDDTRAIVRLVALHHRLDDHPGGWSAPAVRRLLVDAGPYLEDLLTLVSANVDARDDRAVAAERRQSVRAFVEARSELGETAADQQPELGGSAVMAVLGVLPGPVVGEAQAFLRELRIERGPIGRDAAVAALRDWFDRRSV